MNTLNINDGKIIAQYYIKVEGDTEMVFYSACYKIHVLKDIIKSTSISQSNNTEQISYKVSDITKVVIK